MSPDFLFRIEVDPPAAAPGTVYTLSDVELASRLSFFLWSSIPDDELLDQAIRGKLHEPAVLDRQVRRMLADTRARTALVQNFLEQWLQTRNVWLLTPDLNQKFPWFDDNLRVAFIDEMELFLNAQLQEDRSIVDLLTSDQTYLNEQLARHYGISGVYGSHFRRVTLTDANRFGLLGKAGVLAVTSYSTRTAPTLRGKWLLENMLDAPPPAPPPNVPALEVSNEDGTPRSVRGMLEAHREQPHLRQLSCANGSARAEPGKLRCDRTVAHRRRGRADRRVGRPAGRHHRQRSGGSADGAGGAARAVRESGNQQDADLRDRPRAGVLRRAGGTRHRASRCRRRLPLVVDDSGAREERSVPNEEDRRHDRDQEGASPVGPCFAGWVRRSRCRSSTR